jgi:peptidoglycan/LPS O-acetylase OafA/YrhL
MFTQAHPLMAVINVVVLSYAVVVFGSCSTPVLRHAGRFGDLSYGVYLYGFPVAQTLSWAFGQNLPFAAHVFGTLALSLMLAFASWHLVEKPALSLKPGSRRRRQNSAGIGVVDDPPGARMLGSAGGDSGGS